MNSSLSQKIQLALILLRKIARTLSFHLFLLLFMPYIVHHNRKIISEVILAFTSYAEIPKFAHPVSSTKDS